MDRSSPPGHMHTQKYGKIESHSVCRNETGWSTDSTHHEPRGCTILVEIDTRLWRRHQISGNLHNVVALDISEVPRRYALGLREGRVIVRDQAHVGDLGVGDVVRRVRVEVFHVLERLFEAVLRSMAEKNLRASIGAPVSRWEWGVMALVVLSLACSLHHIE